MNGLRPMGVGDILDAAFGLYRRKFATFVAIAAIVYVPFSFLMALLQAYMLPFAPVAPPEDDGNLFNVSMAPAGLLRGLFALGGAPQNIAAGLPVEVPNLLSSLTKAALGMLGLMLLFGVVYPLCSGALVLNISAGYLGEDLGALPSYRRAFSRLGRLLTAQFLVTVFVFLGFMCCFVPGVFLWLWFLLVPIVVMLEDSGPFGSLGRSRALMGGYLGKGFILIVAMAVIGWMLSWAGGALIHFVPWPGEFLSTFLSGLIPGLVLPLGLAALVLLYYDLRIRKEAFDLQVLAEKMEAYREF